MLEGYTNRLMTNYVIGEQDIARELRCSVSTVRRYRNERGLPTQMLVGQVVITRGALDNWVQNQMT